MPIYEYSCDKCHHVFEEWVRHIDDKVEQTCPDCGSPAQRIVSNTSFVLKGGGWYVTDYGYRKGKDESKPAAPASSGGTSEAAPSASSGASPGAEAKTAPSTPSSPASSAGSGASASAA